MPTDDNDEQAIREAGRSHLIDGGPHRGQVAKRDEACFYCRQNDHAHCKPVKFEPVWCQCGCEQDGKP